MSLIDELRQIYKSLQHEKIQKYKRRVSFGDLISERDENAVAYGFGNGTTCYDNVLILGDVTVGSNTWIGPSVILDGSGGLDIGDYCSISAGVQIYSHDTVKWSTSMGKEKEMEYAPTSIGSGVYIGPNSIIQKGVTVGNCAIIGAMSFVNSNIPEDARAWGSPARIIEGSDH